MVIMTLATVGCLQNPLSRRGTVVINRSGPTQSTYLANCLNATEYHIIY